jgi:hypothetical protein
MSVGWWNSDNALSRTETDIDFSPRLLIKVRLPDGEKSYLGPSNVILQPLPPDSDLDEFLTGPDILMVRISGGATWPANGDIAFD